MAEKLPIFHKDFIEQIVKEYPTPFHIYDENGIRNTVRTMQTAFSWVGRGLDKKRQFTNFFAVKALPNPYILKILKEEGFGFDCSSMAELELCTRVGIEGEALFFTSNNTKAEEYVRARELGAIINLDDITHIDYLHEHARMPELICFRYNPGPTRQGNGIIGNPEEAKYGLTREQILEAYPKARMLGAKRFGLHTMVASNELNPQFFIETARMLFDLAMEIYRKTEIKIEFVNLGGGIGIPYRADQVPVDFSIVSEGIRNEYEKSIKNSPLDPLRIVSENGRVITGPHGYLISTAIHEKHTYKEYIGLDSCMANLMRPGMYGAYHHITIIGKENLPADHIYDITGSLCENNDKFAIDRKLPKIDLGDIVVIHDTGAHGHAMGFNYNGKTRSAEVLLKKDGSTQLIRRAETIEDLFATLDFTRV